MFTEGGKIKLFLGPMFSNKKYYLEEDLQKYAYQQKKCILISFEQSNQVSSGSIPIKTISIVSLLDHIEEILEYEIIGIDEGQLFADIAEASELLCNKGKIVIVAALSGNFQMEPFTNISQLISKADKIKMLKAECYYCHNKAMFTLRTVEEKNEILIGYGSYYKPVCKKCYYQRLNGIAEGMEVENI